MKHIYSNYYKTDDKITELKKDILGVVLHDDAENYTAQNYITWLNNRIKKNELEKGWASVYIDQDTCYWFHPTQYTEWHCGNTFANTHYIGIERCQSKINGVLTDSAFMKVEEVSFWLAAAILKKYQLPVNRETVRIHKEFYDTECPARSWLIHLQQASNTLSNVNRLKDYFIYKIKYYYDDITKEDMKSIG